MPVHGSSPPPTPRSEPDQQRARLSRHLPQSPGRPGQPHQWRDEGGGRPGHRGDRHRQRVLPGLHRAERLQPVGGHRGGSRGLEGGARHARGTRPFRPPGRVAHRDSGGLPPVIAWLPRPAAHFTPLSGALELGTPELIVLGALSQHLGAAVGAALVLAVRAPAMGQPPPAVRADAVPAGAHIVPVLSLRHGSPRCAW